MLGKCGPLPSPDTQLGEHLAEKHLESSLDWQPLQVQEWEVVPIHVTLGGSRRSGHSAPGPGTLPRLVGEGVLLQSLESGMAPYTAVSTKFPKILSSSFINITLHDLITISLAPDCFGG